MHLPELMPTLHGQPYIVLVCVYAQPCEGASHPQRGPTVIEWALNICSISDLPYTRSSVDLPSTAEQFLSHGRGASMITRA